MFQFTTKPRLNKMEQNCTCIYDSNECKSPLHRCTCWSNSKNCKAYTHHCVCKNKNQICMIDHKESCCTIS